MAATRSIPMHINKGKTLAQRRDVLLASVREDEERIQEIAVLRKHVINFAKASDTFKQYKASGYNQEFFEAHRELLTLRRVAKKAFDEYEAVHGKGCRPKVKEPQQDRTEERQAENQQNKTNR